MQILFNQEITPREYRIRITGLGEPPTIPAAAMVGQVNGLCGAAVPGWLLLVTAATDRPVRLRLELHDEPPTMDQSWEEIVEVSFTPDTVPLPLRGADSEMYPLGLFGGIVKGTSYRVRYHAISLAVGHDSYLLQLWPAPAASDEVLKQTSDEAARHHRDAAHAADQVDLRNEPDDPETPYTSIKSALVGPSTLVRTDFSDDAAWEAVVDATFQPWELGGGMESRANLTPVNDSRFDGMTVDELFALLAGGSHAFIADERTMTDPDHPILALNNNVYDPHVTNYRTLRVIPSEMASIENNLSLANMWFSEFAVSADESGVFRGFPEPVVLSRTVVLDAAATNASTPVLRSFYEALVESGDVEFSATMSEDLRKNFEFVSTNDYTHCERVIGVDDYLAATREGGRGLMLVLNVPGGFWDSILDRGTLVPRAAMFVAQASGTE